MATLKNLISKGLQVGQLVESRIIEKYYKGKTLLVSRSFWQWDGDFLKCILSDCLRFNVGDTIKPTYNLDIFQLTTAYDSNIDPKTLPIPEPFATGWVACGDKKYPVLRYHYSGEFMIEIECSDNLNSKLNPIHCRPCLPPD